MNTESGFETIKLETSVLCKHNKIAGNVETCFCEADPIRLNDVSPLKRLGPGCCTECHQYNCACVWEKQKPKTQNTADRSGSARCSQTKCAPFENSMLYRLKKRNLFCGNMHSKRMQCVMRPVPKMHFTESEGDLPTSFKDTLSTGKSEIEKFLSDGDSGLGPTRNLYKPELRLENIANKALINANKEYFKRRTRMLDETLRKSSTSSTKPCQSKSSIPMRRSKNHNRESSSKNELPADLNVINRQTKAGEISVKIPKSPGAKPVYVQKNSEAPHYDYKEHINEILNSRCLLSKQKATLLTNSYTLQVDASNHVSYISRFSQQQQQQPSTIPHTLNKTTEFLSRNNENEVTTIARNIDHLEEKQYKMVSKASKTINEQPKEICRNKAFWGTPSIIEAFKDDGHHPTTETDSTDDTLNTSYRVITLSKATETEGPTCMKALKSDENTLKKAPLKPFNSVAPLKPFNSVAVQTEATGIDFMLTISIDTNKSNSEPKDAFAKKASQTVYDKDKSSSLTEPTDKEHDKDSISSSELERKYCNKANVSNNERSSRQETSKVKNIAAFFEAEIQARKEKCEIFDSKVRKTLRTAYDGKKHSETILKSKYKRKVYTANLQETNTAKSKDSGIGIDQTLTTRSTNGIVRKSTESFSDSSVITIVSKKKK